MKYTKADHQKFLKRMGLTPEAIRRNNYAIPFPDLKVESNLPPVSNGFANAGFKKDIHDYKWKKDREESTETIVQINKRAKQISIPYNKGGYQLITDSGDAKFLGRK